MRVRSSVFLKLPLKLLVLCWSVLLAPFLMLASTAAAQQEGLSVESRDDSHSIYKSELREIEEKAKDFRARQQQDKRYQQQVDSHKADYKKKKLKEKRDYELARKLFSKEKKSRKVVPLEVYKPAYDAKQKAWDKTYKKWQRTYAAQQDQIEKAKQKGKNTIPEDEELGLSYKKMRELSDKQK